MMTPDKFQYGMMTDNVDPEINAPIMIVAEEILPDNVPTRINPTPDFTGRWKDSIFGCFNNLSPSLFMACFCEPCLLGQIAEYLSRNGEEHLSTTLTYRFFNIPQLGQLNQLGPFYSIVSIYCLITIFSVLSGFTFTGGYTVNMEYVLPQLFLFAVAFYLRRLLRNRSNIRGQCIEDCCLTWLSCFRPLAIAQMARHIYHYEHKCDSVYASIDAMPDNRVFVDTSNI